MIQKQIYQQHLSTQSGAGKNMTLIGEGLHILNPAFAQAVIKQDAQTLINIASEEITAGAQALAINLGPGKAMAALTPSVIDIITTATDVPLYVSSGIARAENILEKYSSRITINAVTADPETLTAHLQTAKRYGTNIVVLLVKPGLVPAGIHDRLELASEVIGKAIDIDLPLEQLYLDPVITCRPDPLSWKISRGLPDMGSVIETIAHIEDLQQNIKTIVALGSGTQGASRKNRSSLQCRMLRLLAESGITAVILNCRNTELMRTVQEINNEWEQAA